ncbi:MAG: hypothetical protein FJ125_06720 [Deltaproteobacteria bacterium]|nr:hypothetical protein [Deltaproteobacteria bacterium]
MLRPPLLLQPLLLLPPSALLLLLEAALDLRQTLLLGLATTTFRFFLERALLGSPTGCLFLGGFLEIVHQIAEQGVGVVGDAPLDLGFR